MTPTLEIDNLAISFNNGAKPAVRGVSLRLQAGEIVGLVGESGSGKSISALSLMGLLPPSARLDSGEFHFQGRNLADLNPAERRRLCGTHLGMVFQEPLTALNPVLTIGEQVAEIYRYRAGYGRAQARKAAVEMLARVGLPNPAEAARNYPHRFSGGMRQRVVIAMALALAPEVLVADEPTTALDPTIAAQILALLARLTAAGRHPGADTANSLTATSTAAPKNGPPPSRGSAVLFITHNLRLLTGLAQRVLVMYTGLVVEEAGVPGIFTHPAHPYTQGLLKALPPALSEPAPERLRAIGGTPPIPGQWPRGCPFEPRCDYAFLPCRQSLPPLYDLGGGHMARCFLYAAGEKRFNFQKPRTEPPVSHNGAELRRDGDQC